MATNTQALDEIINALEKLCEAVEAGLPREDAQRSAEQRDVTKILSSARRHIERAKRA